MLRAIQRQWPRRTASEARQPSEPAAQTQSASWLECRLLCRVLHTWHGTNGGPRECVRVYALVCVCVLVDV